MGTAQQANANYVDTVDVFSTSDYWSGEELDVTPKFNLNEYEAVIEDTESAVYKARSYTRIVFGENAEAIGRLLTYEEATALKEAIETDETGKIEEILWGQANTQDDGNYLYYWLGSADDEYSDSVWYVHGKYEGLSVCRFDGVDACGVRPVIEILKSEI